MNQSSTKPEFAGIFETLSGKLVYFRYSESNPSGKPFTIFSFKQKNAREDSEP